MMPYRCLASFYGGKARIAHRYPPPRHDTIIEPFAGGAGYALRYAERSVHLYDVNPQVVALWRYVIQTPLDVIVAAIPPTVTAGARVSELIDIPSAAPGLVALLRAGANHGTFGCRGTCDVITPVGAQAWYRIIPRVTYMVPRIRHWTITHGSYEQIPNMPATWFIDPPYYNKAGRVYCYQVTSYQALADWCQTRRGQVIVCENEGATWLPFVPLTRSQSIGLRGRAMESVWIRP